MKPGVKTKQYLILAHPLFEQFMKELEKDYCELIDIVFEHDAYGKKTQDAVDMAFIAFCLGALNSIDEKSAFFNAIAKDIDEPEVESSCH